MGWWRQYGCQKNIIIIIIISEARKVVQDGDGNGFVFSSSFFQLVQFTITSSDSLIANVTKPDAEDVFRSKKLSKIFLPLIACFCVFFVWIFLMTGNCSTVWINFFLNLVTLRVVLSKAILSWVYLGGS